MQRSFFSSNSTGLCFLFSVSPVPKDLPACCSANCEVFSDHGFLIVSLCHNVQQLLITYAHLLLIAFFFLAYEINPERERPGFLVKHCLNNLLPFNGLASAFYNKYFWKIKCRAMQSLRNIKEALLCLLSPDSTASDSGNTVVHQQLY